MTGLALSPPGVPRQRSWLLRAVRPSYGWLALISPRRRRTAKFQEINDVAVLAALVMPLDRTCPVYAHELKGHQKAARQKHRTSPRPHARGLRKPAGDANPVNHLLNDPDARHIDLGSDYHTHTPGPRPQDTRPSAKSKPSDTPLCALAPAA